MRLCLVCRPRLLPIQPESLAAAAAAVVEVAALQATQLPSFCLRRYRTFKPQCKQGQVANVRGGEGFGEGGGGCSFLAGGGGGDSILGGTGAAVGTQHSCFRSDVYCVRAKIGDCQQIDLSLEQESCCQEQN